jgi:hypothetical protein
MEEINPNNEQQVLVEEQPILIDATLVETKKKYVRKDPEYLKKYYQQRKDELIKRARVNQDKFIKEHNEEYKLKKKIYNQTYRNKVKEHNEEYKRKKKLYNQTYRNKVKESNSLNTI